MSEEQLDLFGDMAERVLERVERNLALDDLSKNELIALIQRERAESAKLQRRIDHMRLSMMVFEHLHYAFSDDKQGQITVQCPECMHETKLDSGVEVGAKRAFTCKKCKGELEVIIGLNHDQIIKVTRP